MRFRAGLIVGAGVGYYFGAKAGRRRYIQLTRTMRKVRDSEPIENASGKIKAVIDLTRERARDAFEQEDAEEFEIAEISSNLN
jgi:hypothetical protein